MTKVFAKHLTLLHRRQPQISIRNPSKTDHPPKHFTFDAVYDETTQQKAFYEESCYDLVEGVMEGYNGTIFAYGQVTCITAMRSWLLPGLRKIRHNRNNMDGGFSTTAKFSLGR